VLADSGGLHITKWKDDTKQRVAASEIKEWVDRTRSCYRYSKYSLGKYDGWTWRCVPCCVWQGAWMMDAGRRAHAHGRGHTAVAGRGVVMATAACTNK
jgi:hypothetical protein